MTRALVRPLRSDSAIRLFCLPFAGGSASAFRDWPRHVPHAVEIVPLEMRGRGTRHGERPFDRLAPFVDEAIDAIGGAADRPFALFGHSMGALAAFEIACTLAAGGPSPSHLFVSAHAAPNIVPDAPPAHRLSDADLLAHLRRLEAAPAALAEPELMQLMLPVVRADLAACETFVYRPRPPLECGITAFGGTSDPLVPKMHLLEWRRHTLASFRLEMYVGEHFFINACLPAVLDSALTDLRRWGLLEAS